MGLIRLQNDDDLTHFVEAGYLVPLIDTYYIKPNPKLDENRRFVRPWVNVFLDNFASDFYNKYHKPLFVTSAVRTALVQKRLRKHNHNAADYKGDFASSHLTGATVDIGKNRLTRSERKYLLDKLLKMQDLGQVIFIDEHRQPCYHVMVIW